MKVHPFAYGVLAVAIFATSLAFAGAVGAWRPTSGTGAGTGTGEGSGGGAVLPADPVVTDIRGRTPIGDVAEAWGIPLADILAAFDLAPDTDPASELRTLESDTFSVDALRDWLEAGGPADGSGPEGSPAVTAPTSP